MLNRVAGVSHSRLAVESPIFIRVGNMQKCMIPLCQLCVCIVRRPELMNVNPSELTIRFDSTPTRAIQPRYT